MSLNWPIFKNISTSICQVFSVRHYLGSSLGTLVSLSSSSPVSPWAHERLTHQFSLDLVKRFFCHFFDQHLFISLSLSGLCNELNIFISIFFPTFQFRFISTTICYISIFLAFLYLIMSQRLSILSLSIHFNISHVSSFPLLYLFFIDVAKFKLQLDKKAQTKKPKTKKKNVPIFVGKFWKKIFIQNLNLFVADFSKGEKVYEILMRSLWLTNWWMNEFAGFGNQLIRSYRYPVKLALIHLSGILWQFFRRYLIVHMKVFRAQICSNMTLEKVSRMTHSNIGRFLCLFAGRDVQAGVYPIVYFIWRIFLSSFIQKQTLLLWVFQQYSLFRWGKM